MTTIQERISKQAEEIVRKGEQVRENIARLYAESAAVCHRQTRGVREFTEAVLSGAVQGAKGSEAGDPASVLGQVVEGLGDGLSDSANAIRLTIEEAGSQGKAFAEEDLEKIARDLQALAGMFEETVKDAAERLGTGAARQAGSLKQHATRTMDSVRPRIDAAVTAALKAPAKLGKDILNAGVKVSRHAAGTLFAEIGSRLGRLGENLRKD